MSEGLLIEVIGTPAPQGSKRAYVRGGRAVLVESSPAVRTWREDVRAACREQWHHNVLTGPVSIAVAFRWRRPRGHYGRRGLLPSAPEHKTTAPDLDKVLRATLDALTGQVLADDSLVVAVRTGKAWAAVDELPGATIVITPLHDGGEG